MPPNLADVLVEMDARGFHVFGGDRQPDLNLVVLRTTPGKLDAFDDWFGCFCGIDRLHLVDWWWPCTADPGKPAIEGPKRRDGTAVLNVGQHHFTFGTHHPGTRGAYECLSGIGPLPVTRYLDALAYSEGRGTPSTSTGIQVHHAKAHATSTVVGPWSDACMVLADDVHDFPTLMRLCHAQANAGLGSRFTVSVLPWLRP